MKKMSEKSTRIKVLLYPTVIYRNIFISVSARTSTINIKKKKRLADQDNTQREAATPAATSTAAAAADHSTCTCWRSVIDIFHRSSCPQFFVHFYRFHAFTWLFSSYAHLSFLAL
jgi:hypothetical protein